MVSVVIFLIVISSGVFIFAQTIEQGCVTTVISTQISQFGMHSGNATVPSVVEKVVDDCVRWNAILAAVSRSLSTLLAAILGATLSRSRAGPSTGVSAHYEPDTHRLVLLFHRPVVAQNPQRMVLLYRHVDRWPQ